MQRKLVRVVTSVLVCVAFGASCAAGAPAMQPLRFNNVTTAAVRPHPLRRGHRLGAHHIFGTILGISGNMLSVRRRSGRVVTVDAATAIANDDYSYPLFIGKMVAIDGAFSSATIFAAAHINAIASLQSLETDK